MALFGFTASTRAQGPPKTLMGKGLRYLLIALGLVIIALGIPLAPLPWLHVPGIFLIALGLVLVLRNSFGARRIFIKAQRRHPKIVFPIRRLIRREPEVWPVLWQQMLRFEAWVLPKRFRFWRRLRLALRGRRRAA